MHPGRRSPLSTATTPSAILDDQGLINPDLADPGITTSNATAEATDVSQLSSRPISTHVKPRVLTDDNIEGSERTSVDFYSLSNHSQETVMSEQPSVMSERPLMSALNIRPNLRLPPNQRPRTVKMLMGYAHVTGNFTLDGSLVNQTPFEEVKQKGFLGGQRGGGVVGATHAKRSSGLLSGFSLDSIGESLSGIMSGNNLSSVKEMKAIASSRTIPLLSTPQSLLFVDMNLDPGEERSFTFKYRLPRGLPSSFRGKAIRINYNLTLGVQYASGGRESQQMKQINIPIRLFSGVSREGEILGHDLMQPHVILQDLARTKQMYSAEVEESSIAPESTKIADSSKLEFLRFVETLLDPHKRRQSSTLTLDSKLVLSETEASNPSVNAINRAIMFSSQSEASGNRFEIARNGVQVAVVVVDRPLHRLGETVTCVIDFSGAQVHCASVHASLETTEKVNASLAVRSTATISRVTKRVYAAHAENVLFAKTGGFLSEHPQSGNADVYHQRCQSRVGNQHPVRHVDLIPGSRRQPESGPGSRRRAD